MTIQDAHELCLSDITSNLLSDSQRKFNRTLIKDLQLDDMTYLLRHRMWVEPLVRLVIDKIERNWAIVQLYYPDTVLTEWIEDVMAELILLPRRVWDLDHVSFYKLVALTKRNAARPLRIEAFIIEAFLQYTPQELVWDDDALASFETHYNSHHGEVLVGINQIRELVVALHNGVGVRYKRRGQDYLINRLSDFIATILPELSDAEGLQTWIENEKPLSY